MDRILFIALQLVVLLTTLFVAVDSHLYGSLAISLSAALPVRALLWLNTVGFPLVGDGGGAVCPLTCSPGWLLTALSLLAIGLSARQLWRLWKSPQRSVPPAFGPIERLLAGAGLLLAALKGVLLLVGMFFPALGAVGSVILDMFIRAVTLGWMINATNLVHLLLAAAFWIVEIKQLPWFDASGRTSRSCP